MKTPLQHETTVQKPRLMLIFNVFSFFYDDDDEHPMN